VEAKVAQFTPQQLSNVLWGLANLTEQLQAVSQQQQQQQQQQWLRTAGTHCCQLHRAAPPFVRGSRGHPKTPKPHIKVTKI